MRATDAALHVRPSRGGEEAGDKAGAGGAHPGFLGGLLRRLGVGSEGRDADVAVAEGRAGWAVAIGDHDVVGGRGVAADAGGGAAGARGDAG